MAAQLNRTEGLHPAHSKLDTYDTATLLAALVDDHAHAVAAVRAATSSLGQAVDAAVPRLRAGGRLVYVGAGTSGRLGCLDAAELPPTFSWLAERALGLLAGGLRAMTTAVEGAEDDAEQGAADLSALKPGAGDVVLAIAASGRTPYTLGAIDAARQAGALALALVNNPGTPLAARADIAIVLDTGPEVIAGSTRLKAGTAQKIALNSLSSALMVRLHRVHGQLMVEVQPSNAKLRRRALDLVLQISGWPPEAPGAPGAAEAAAAEAAAAAALAACGQRIKPAVLVLQTGCSPEQALSRLADVDGNLRAAMATR